MQKVKKRERRLQAAKQWIAKYEGNNLVKGYRKRFGVDILCAITELQLLGHKFTAQYIDCVKKGVEAQRMKRLQKKQQKELDALVFADSDDTFYFIAGYTSGGAPYGITWEEAKSMVGEEEG